MMDAVKFLSEYARMCDTVEDCKDCPFHIAEYDFCRWDLLDNRNPFTHEEAVDLVEKWSAENPLEE